MKELTTVHSDEEIVASLQLKPHFKSQEMDTEIKMLYASKRDLSDNQKGNIYIYIYIYIYH